MTKYLVATISLLVLFVLGADIAQAGSAKLPADFMFAGQPLRSGPHSGYDTITHATLGDDASVLGISPDGRWLFVWSDSGDGWAPTTSMHVDGDVTSLSVWSTPMRGYSFQPTGHITRPTDLKVGANPTYDTLTCIPPNQFVKLLAQSDDGHWVFIWSDAGDGWVPRSAVSSDADLTYLSVWTLPMTNASIGN